MATDLTIGILALQGDAREHLSAVAALGVLARPVRRVAELVGLNGLILPGGESSTIDKLARSFGLHEPIIALRASGLPIFGSCAGLIALADRILDSAPGQQNFGGLDITVRRNAFGRQIASFEAELELDMTDRPVINGVFIRAPWVEECGPKAQPLATVASGPAAGRIVAVRQGPLLGTAFHPEITGEHQIHQLFCDMVQAANFTVLPSFLPEEYS